MGTDRSAVSVHAVRRDALTFLVPLAFYPLFGWNSVLIAGALRTAALMTATGFVNSVCHKWGSRAKDSRGREYRADDSRNVFVAVVAGGEGNHSWHHADPACPRHGRRVVLDAQALAAGAGRERGWRPDATAARCVPLASWLVSITSPLIPSSARA